MNEEIYRKWHGQWLRGEVIGASEDVVTREGLYVVLYEDNEREQLSGHDLIPLLLTPEERPEAEYACKTCVAGSLQGAHLPERVS